MGRVQSMLRMPVWLRDLPLVWRIFSVNAAVFAAGAAALALSPATVSFPIVLTEALVLTTGLAAMLLVNLLLLRRSFAPLDRLTSLMRRVDLLRPGERLVAAGPPEVRALGSVFNEMLDRLERERHESGRETMLRVEDERKRVARELHDELGQSLTSVMLMLSRLVDAAPHTLRDDLLEAREATRSTLDGVRFLAQRLRPEALDDLGLVAALTALTRSFGDATGLVVDRAFDDSLPDLAPEVELAVFRIAQESLTNAARHADAARVIVEVRRIGRSGLRLRVRDDGSGLDGPRFGSGIRGMQERALHVGGRLAVYSPESGGVEVRFTFPA